MTFNQLNINEESIEASHNNKFKKFVSLQEELYRKLQQEKTVEVLCYITDEIKKMTQHILPEK
jgi:hypothetical protein